MNFLLPLISTLFGLILMNSLILVNSHTCRSRTIRCLPVEARYISLFAFFLLIILNGNQWISGDLLFPLVTVAALVLLIRSIKRLSASSRKTVVHDGISLLIAQIASISFLIFAFQIYRYWLLESHNHDSIIYYYGSYWANESRIFVGSEAVRARWGFDTWIGFDKPLYRGGTYTLEAWILYFSPRFSGSSLYYIAAYAATMAWFAVKLITPPSKGTQLVTLLAILISLSTGIIGPLVNSNLATVMGGSSLMLIFALALRNDLQLDIRYALMVTWCAVCVHFYGESVFYGGLLVLLTLILELPTLHRAFGTMKIIRLIASLVVIIIVLGNIPIAQSFSSLLLFSNIAKGGNWTSWYLHQPFFFWVGSFIAGLLMGVDPSFSTVFASSVISLFSMACLIHSSRFRKGAFALLGLSLLSIVYITIASYQYGEHKIVHLLGPSWSLAIVAAILLLLENGHITFFCNLINTCRSILAASIISTFGAVIFVFLYNSTQLLNRMSASHSIDYGIDTLASFIRPGDFVLVDDNDWVGVEKFFKTHYIVFQLEHQGAKVLMPNIDSDALRGGYQRNFVNDTFKDADRVDWLLKGKGNIVEKDKFIAAYGQPVWENRNYRLYRTAKKPLVVAGNGWYDCELLFCWTSAPFELEAKTPSAGTYNLIIDYSAFVPPDLGLIHIRTSDGNLIRNVSARNARVQLRLSPGWSKFVFEPDWSISSPKQFGMSKDPRKLFLAIQRIEIKSEEYNQ